MKNKLKNTSSPAYKNCSVSNAKKRKSRFRCGHTMVELTFASTICLIAILATGVLFVSGNRAWLKTYESANKKIKQDSQN